MFLFIYLYSNNRKLLSIINGTSSKVYDSNPYNVRQHFFMAEKNHRGITITFNCFFDGFDKIVLLTNILIHFDA